MAKRQGFQAIANSIEKSLATKSLCSSHPTTTKSQHEKTPLLRSALLWRNCFFKKQ
jgi:hypothetical protein